jgi:hypothetical protein
MLALFCAGLREEDALANRCPPTTVDSPSWSISGSAAFVCGGIATLASPSNGNTIEYSHVKFGNLRRYSRAPTWGLLVAQLVTFMAPAQTVPQGPPIVRPADPLSAALAKLKADRVYRVSLDLLLKLSGANEDESPVSYAVPDVSLQQRGEKQKTLEKAGVPQNQSSALLSPGTIFVASPSPFSIARALFFRLWPTLPPNVRAAFQEASNGLQPATLDALIGAGETHQGDEDPEIGFYANIIAWKVAHPKELPTDTVATVLNDPAIKALEGFIRICCK